MRPLRIDLQTRVCSDDSDGHALYNRSWAIQFDRNKKERADGRSSNCDSFVSVDSSVPYDHKILETCVWVGIMLHCESKTLKTSF